LEGNQFFKEKLYQQAAEKYFEAIIEIEGLSQTKDPELCQLEISCRSNYMTSKAILKEFDTVIVQANLVIDY
jgi:hypothetical protein